MGFAGGVFEINEYIFDPIKSNYTCKVYRIIWTNDSSKEFKSLNEIILQVLKGQPWVWTLENLVHYSDKWGGQGYFRDSWLGIICESWFVIWRNVIPWIVINMRAVNREELKGLARILNLFYTNLWMFTFKTRPKFNIMVKKRINLLPAVVFLEVSSFHR
jgi:hypothetical protein